MGSPFRFEPSLYPEEPGCYLMFHEHGQLLYVGKAINLRKRLASYFHSKPDREKTARLVQQIASIEIMIVRNENESFSLETNLIQHYLPPYNRAKKGEPSVYPYIAVTREPLPRLVAVDKDRLTPQSKAESCGDGELIGPFPNPVFRNYSLEFAIARYRLRTCEPLERRLCMRYYFETCGGICEQLESAEQYDERVFGAARLLSDARAIPAEMVTAMEECSEKLQFEKAKELYTRSNTLKSMLDDQAVNIPRDFCQIVLLFDGDMLLAAPIEYGMLRSRFVERRVEEPVPEAGDWAEELLRMVPSEGRVEIVTNDAERAEPLRQAAKSRGLPAKISVPLKGPKRHLLDICERNMTYRSGLRMEQGIV